jgi:hypothetical protein
MSVGPIPHALEKHQHGPFSVCGDDVVNCWEKKAKLRLTAAPALLVSGDDLIQLCFVGAGHALGGEIEQ